jgi:hypothetical protein
MNTQYAHYTRFAAELATNGYKAPKRHLTNGERHVIAIYELLKDGEWHTASEVMTEIESISKVHTQNLIRSLKEPLAIASGQQGYCIPNKNTVLIA